MVTKDQLQGAARVVGALSFHYGTCTRKVGPRGGVKLNIETWRANGQLKTWKTRPLEFRLPIARGMYEHGYMTPCNAGAFHTADDCPLYRDEQAVVVEHMDNAGRYRECSPVFMPRRLPSRS